MFELSRATVEDFTPDVLNDIRELQPDLEDEGGFRRVARSPHRYGTDIYKVTNSKNGRAHFIAVRDRFCWYLECWYMGFCYPDGELLRNVPEFLAAMEELATERLGDHAQAHACLTSLSDEAHNALRERPGNTDPEGLAEYTYLQLDVPGSQVKNLRSGVTTNHRGLWEWQSATGTVVGFATLNRFEPIYQLQNVLKNQLTLPYPDVHAGLYDLLKYDWTRSQEANLERLRTHGAMLAAFNSKGEVAATAWFYPSHNVLRGWWELWGRLAVVNLDCAGRGFNHDLWDGAVALLAPTPDHLRLKTLVHPASTTGMKSLERYGFTRVSRGRTRYVRLVPR